MIVEYNIKVLFIYVFIHIINHILVIRHNISLIITNIKELVILM